jgi:predicted AlkP superfamily phosphohydrolase/phosphomutase
MGKLARRKNGLTALGLGLALLLPLSALAYIGPGAGFAILGSFMVFFFAFVAAVLSMLIWPVRAVWRFIQVRRLGIKPHVDRVVILGLDGLDPKRAQKLMDQGKLPHFKALARQGCFHPLATTYPAISPVAWSTFATGVNPGKHAIFDFLTPDRKTYLPVLSSTHIGKVGRVLKLGKYRIPLGRPELRLLRKSVPFWKILGDHWIFSHVLRVPITWPPEKFYGALLSAMCVPDLKGSQGTFTFYTTAAGDKKHTGGVEIKLERNGDGYRAYLPGPENSLTEQQEELRIPFTLSKNGGDSSWNLKLPDRTIQLAPGKYSGWVPLAFPAGLGIKVHGIAQFRLLRTEPEVELYLSPIHLDPESPAMPISHPSIYSMVLAKLQGPYATLGLAEDTWGLNERVLDEDAFLEMTYTHHAEREAMFFHALRRTRRGACVCVFDATDRIQHMFHRYDSADHPANADKDTQKHKSAIEELYVRMDDLVGRVMKEMKPRDVLMVVSDHGFGSFERGINLNSWLWKNGYLACKSASGSGEYFQEVDWSRTKAYMLGLGGVYLNLKGREAQGIVEPGAEADALRQELAAKLKDLSDEKRGAIAINEAFLGPEVFHGPYRDQGPDLVIGYNLGYRASWEGVLGVVNDVVFDDNVKSWSGDHCVDPRLVPGVLFSNRKIDGQDPGLIDIAPTVLRLFDVAVPRHMDGKPLIKVNREK